MATIGDDVMQAFSDIKLRCKYRYVIIKIEDLVIQVDKFGARDADHEDFIAALPGSNCRYALYDHEFVTNDKRKTSKLFLFHWSPPNSNDTGKVLYTQSLPAFIHQLPGVVKVAVCEEEEIEDELGV